MSANTKKRIARLKRQFKTLVLMEKDRPSLSGIAGTIGIDRSTAKKWRKQLEDQGLYFESFSNGRPKKDRV